jgi:hypothetical protein
MCAARQKVHASHHIRATARWASSVTAAVRVVPWRTEAAPAPPPAATEAATAPATSPTAPPSAGHVLALLCHLQRPTLELRVIELQRKLDGLNLCELDVRIAAPRRTQVGNALGDDDG